VLIRDCIFGPLQGGPLGPVDAALGFFGETRGVRVENCIFRNIHFGISLGVALVGGGESCYDASVTGCHFDQGRTAIIVGGHNCTISRNVMKNQWAGSMVVAVGEGDVAHDNVISHNVMDNTTLGSGLVFDTVASSVDRTIIDGNIITGSRCIAANRGTRCIIKNNIITVVDGDPLHVNVTGIVVEGIAECLIQGNVIHMAAVTKQGGAIWAGPFGAYPCNIARIADNLITGTVAPPALITDAAIGTGPTTRDAIITGNHVDTNNMVGIMVWNGHDTLILTNNYATGHASGDLVEVAPVATNRYRDNNHMPVQVVV
jgi:hypothetical protein